MSNQFTIILNAEDAVESLNDTHKRFNIISSDLDHAKHRLIGVQSFNMPYSFHTFSSSNNTFDIKTYNGVDEYTQTLTIDTDTTYTISELMSVINSKFSLIKSSLGLTSLSITYNTNRNKCYVNCSPVMETLTFSNISCYKQMGFVNSDDYVFNNALTQNYFPYCPDLSGPSSIYIRLHNKKIRTYTSKPDGKGVDGIICNIPCMVWNTQIIYYHTDNPQFHYSSSEVMNVGGGALSLAGQPELGLPMMMAGKFTGKASKLLKQAAKKKKKK
jgi:hypothetical protein